MGINQTKRGKITWGAAYANILTFQFNPDMAISYTRALEGSQFITTIAGTRDAWVTDEFCLDITLRWLYTTHGTYSAWDGVTGIERAISYMRAMNPIRWYPDAASGTYITSYLGNPDATPVLEADGSRAIQLLLVNTTTAYEGY